MLFIILFLVFSFMAYGIIKAFLELVNPDKPPPGAIKKEK